MTDSFSLVYKKMPREQILALKNYFRGYYHTRLRGTDAKPPKMWPEKHSIMLYGWNRDDVDSALRFIGERSIGGLRQLQPEVVPLEEELSEDLSLETPSSPLTELQESAKQEDGVQKTTVPSVNLAMRSSKYLLLITDQVLDLLSEIPPNSIQPIREFLEDLTSDRWEIWENGASGFRCWMSEAGKRSLFTRTFRDIGTFVWERLQTVDVLQVMAYPMSPYGMSVGDGSIMASHIVIYELREGDDEPPDHFAFQGSILAPKSGLNDPKNYEPPENEDQLTYGDPLYLLSIARIPDLLAGVQRGLPIHLALEQARVLSAPGPVLLGGEAGSGKSSVIVQWLMMNHLKYEQQKDKDSPPLEQLFVTYSPRLRDRAELDFDRMLPRQYKSHSTHFRTYRQILMELMTSSGQSDRFNLDNEVNLEKFLEIFSSKTSSDVDPLLLWDEIRSAIKGASVGEGNKFIEKQTYRELNDKKGRCKTPTNLRDSYYGDAVRYQLELVEESLWDAIDLAQACFAKTDILHKYERIACDEVQDLAPVEIRFLIQMLGSRSIQGLFLTGDVAQVINPSGFLWKRLKGDLGELSNGATIPDVITFDRNYRSTSQIVALVNDVLALRKQILDDEVSKLEQKTPISGEQLPVVLTQDPIVVLQQEVTNPERRLVLVKTPAEKEKLQVKLGNNVIAQSILTIEEAKGLEWDGVLLYNFFTPRHESVNRNEWSAVFDPTRRGNLMEQISTGTLNPYGLTYEFNMLHVGLTRAKKIIAFYDADNSMNIVNLNPGISEHLDHSDLDPFRLIWRTDPPLAADWKKVGERLLEHDSPQGRNFLKLAAIQFQKEEKFSEGAECFEKAFLFDKAAECFSALGNRAEELRVLSRMAEKSEDFERAAGYEVERAEIFVNSGLNAKASEPFFKAQEFYVKAGKFEAAAESATRQGDSYPTSNRGDRSRSYVRAANLYQQILKTNKAITMLNKAISEAESVVASEPIGGMSQGVWLAERYSQLSDLLAEKGDLGESARAARKASGKWQTAASNSQSPFSKGQYIANSRDWLVKSVERFIKARQLGAAGNARKELKSNIDKQVYDNWIIAAWKSFAAEYKLAKDFDELVDTTLELMQMIVERDQLSTVMSLFREVVSDCKLNNAKRASGKLVVGAVDVSKDSSEKRVKIELLSLRSQLLEEQRSFEAALEDRKEVCRYYFGNDLVEYGRSEVDAAKQCALQSMKTERVGRFLLVDVVCDFLSISYNKPREKIARVEEATTYFAQDETASGIEIGNILNDINKEIQELESRSTAEENSISSQEKTEQIAKLKENLGWCLLGKYLTESAIARMKGISGPPLSRSQFDEIQKVFKEIDDTDSASIVAGKYGRTLG